MRLFRRFWRFIMFCLVMVWWALKAVIATRGSDHAGPMKRAAFQQMGSRKLCRIAGLRISVVGEWPRDRAVLAVANHVGILDPWILATATRGSFVAKAEMARWPIMGWVCKAVGIIFVDRTKKMSTTSFVDQVRKRMRGGVPVIVFPEGTTSDGSDLLPFKTGSFAAVSNMDDGFVLPMYFHARAVEGTPTNADTRTLISWVAPETLLANVWRLFGMSSIDIEIRIGNLIPTKNKDRKLLSEDAREQMLELARAAHLSASLSS